HSAGLALCWIGPVQPPSLNCASGLLATSYGGTRGAGTRLIPVESLLNLHRKGRMQISMPPPQIYVEKTLAIIKPDIVDKEEEIQDIILRSGFTIVQFQVYNILI
uniref:NME/NM23 family member 5 n=1 Tax=Felis catus TaxID=9685 RepID=A0ABI7YR40_FELCA